MKEKLHQAGLGHKKVCFNWKANAVDVKTKLEEVFPKLAKSGGFDILRHGQQTSELVLIQVDWDKLWLLFDPFKTI